MKTFSAKLKLSVLSGLALFFATILTAEAQVSQLTQPSAEQIVILQNRVVEFRNSVTSDFDQASKAEQLLLEPGDCTPNATIRTCLENKLNQLTARAGLIENPEQLEQIQQQIQDLQLQLDAPQELRKTATSLNQFANTLDEMLRNNDFTFKQQFGIIWHSLVGSWKFLISPVALTALSLGGVGYELADRSGLDQTAKNAFNFTPSRPVAALKEIGTLCGYGVCMLPIAVIALITKDPNSIEAMDAMIVGTGLVEALGTLEKNTIRGDRPTPRDAGSFDRWGTPSLHASESSMMTTVVCRHYKKIWCGVAIAVAAGVEVSREVGGDHYPSQLLLGTGLGIAAGYAADRAVQNATRKEKASRSDMFIQALTGNMTYKGINFDYKPEMLSHGGTGAHLIIKW